MLNEDEGRKAAYSGLQVGLLAALCFPTCNLPQLRLATDFLTLLFLWNDDTLSFESHEIALERLAPHAKDELAIHLTCLSASQYMAATQANDLRRLASKIPDGAACSQYCRYSKKRSSR